MADSPADQSYIAIILGSIAAALTGLSLLVLGWLNSRVDRAEDREISERDKLWGELSEIRKNMATKEDISRLEGEVKASEERQTAAIARMGG